MTVFADQFQRAETLREQERYAEALDLYCELLQARLGLASHAATSLEAIDIILMERVADLALFHAKPSVAAQILESARSILNDAGNLYSADWASVKAASAHLVAGNWSVARKALFFLSPRIGEIEKLDFTPAGLARWEVSCQWSGVSEQERQALLARILLEAGRQAAACGQYRRAICALERAFEKCKNSEEPLLRDSRGPMVLELASARLERGDLPGCQEALGQFSKCCRGLAAEDVTLREIEGKLALLRGDLGLALDALHQVQQQCVRMGVRQFASTAALNLAHVLILVNQTARAAEIAEGLLAEAACDGDAGKAHCACVLLELVRIRGRSLADGVAIAPSITEWWLGTSRNSSPAPRGEIPVFDASTSRSFLDLFELRSLTFFWLLARQDWSDARAYLGDLDRVFGETDSMVIVCRRLVLDGVLSYYEDLLGDSERLLSEAAQAAEELGLVHDQWQLLRVLGWIGEKKQDPAAADRARTAAEQLLRRMSLSLDETQRPVFLLNKWTEEEERLAKQVDQLSRFQRQKSIAPRLEKWRAGIVALRNTIDLLHRIDEYRRGVVTRSVGSNGAAGRADHLEPWWRIFLAYCWKTALVRMLVLPDRVAIATLCRGQAHIGVSAVTRVEVRQRVGAIHNALKESGRTDIFYREMDRLSEILQWQAALETLPAGVHRLLILPDDSLHGVPFAALPCGGTLTGERWNLAIGFEAIAFEARATRHKGRRHLGLSLGLPYGDSDFAPLHGAITETRLFEQWCSRRKLQVEKLQPDVRMTEVMRRLPEARFAHVACHGVFRPDRPDESGLVIINEKGEREIVTIRAFSRLDFSALQLGVFTSCWGADSFVLPGRFVISLPEICWRAGMTSILASMWGVSDEVAVPFLGAFYRYLDGCCPDEALRLAQKDCRSNALSECPLKDTTDPFFWAGFQFYGTPRRVPQGSSQSARVATSGDLGFDLLGHA